MTRKRNPMERLRRLREIKERTERLELGKAHVEDAEAQAAAEEARREEERDRLPTDLIRPAQLRAMQLMGVRLTEIRKAAEAAREESRMKLKAQTESWQRAAVDRDAAEALSERRKRADATVARMAAERALDDLQIVTRRRR